MATKSAGGDLQEKARAWIATVVLAGVVLALGVEGARSAGRRLGALGIGERLELLKGGEEARIRRALGRGAYPFYEAVKDTPPEALIALRAPVTRETFFLRLHLETLLFPRRVAFFHAVSGLVPAAGAAGGRPFYVLDLAPGEDFPGRERAAQLGRGARHVLWRLREGPP